VAQWECDLKQEFTMNDQSPTRYATQATDPTTGEVFAAHLGQPSPEFMADMMTGDSMIEKRSAEAVKLAAFTIDPSRKIIEHGPSQGSYLGRSIPETFRTGDGALHIYVGVTGPTPNLESLLPTQSIIAPGLLYDQAAWVALTADNHVEALLIADANEASLLDGFREKHSSATIKLMPITEAWALPKQNRGLSALPPC
jgi:hypothetical protein